jgi:hypothetical protein
LLILLLIAGLVIWIRKLLRPKLNKRAKVEIDQIISHYQTHQDQLQLVQQLSAAIRRIGISYLAREQHAGEVGEAWYQHINALAPAHAFDRQSIRLLLEVPYQKNRAIEDNHIQRLLEQSRSWVRALPVDPQQDAGGEAQHV